ncbi:FtsX-like permease family protein [Chitinophaga sancti]|uniref:ABC transporter permease n=1 Tax=Chitinophaga sancti TaxID=1004 RepID=UPI002A75F62C|nr:FtsX-like permease family protein [Chitinophaga sancti]WPQ62674.1 FtsX-like permease family protein [Chitinophaga sancti]
MIIKLIFANLRYKWLSTLLSWILLLFGVAIISLLWTLQQQLEHKFDNELKNIDLVVGAKGSPLQLVLSAVYHVDAPTGNINEIEAARLTHNPMIEWSIPLAYGDNYKGYSIVGTTLKYIINENGRLANGRIFQEPMEAVIGSNVKASEGLEIGSTFLGTHGQDEHGHQHKGLPYKVVGILKPAGTMADNLILTDIATVRLIHEHHDIDDKDEDEGKQVETEITALLIKFRSPMGMMTFPRTINQTTNMQAAVPTLEINRLMGLIGIGIDTLQYVALAIMMMAGLSVFISLLNRLKERKYELALLRSLGYSRLQLFLIVISEAMLLSFAGFLSGVAVSRLGLILLNYQSNTNFKFYISVISKGEIILLGITLLIGLVASLIPALTIYWLNISKILSDE